VLETADARAVEPNPFREEFVRELFDRNAEVLPRAWEVNELQIDHYQLVIADQVVSASRCYLRVSFGRFGLGFGLTRALSSRTHGRSPSTLSLLRYHATWMSSSIACTWLRSIATVAISPGSSA